MFQIPLMFLVNKFLVTNSIEDNDIIYSILNMEYRTWKIKIKII